MANRGIFWAGFMSAAATIPLVQIVAIGATVPEINKIAESITVKIAEPKSQGSGVILQQQGDIYTILTAAHVLKSKNVLYTILTSDGQKYPAIVDSIRRPAVDIDLAVIKFRTTNKYPTAKLGNCNSISGGMDLYVGGYPLPTSAIDKSVFLFKRGIVASNSTLVLNKGYSLIYDNQTLPGMSGGAVLNQNGELVAIHGRGDRERDADGNFGAKTGNNLGIPINRFASIASSLGVNLNQTVVAIPQTQGLKADDYYALAVQKYHNGDRQGAIANFNKAIDLNPKYIKAYNNRGAIEYKLGQQQAAIVDFNKAISINPSYAEAYSNRGSVKSDLGDKQAAIIDFNKAIAIDPNFAEAYYNRGNAKSDLGDKQAAIIDYNKAIALDPSDVESYNNRGNVKADLGQQQAAMSDYDKAIAINPNYADAYSNRGGIKSELGDQQAAIIDYDKGIAINPNYADAYYNRGIAKYELGNRQGGITDLTTAATLFRQLSRMDDYNKAMNLIKKFQG